MTDGVLSTIKDWTGATVRGCPWSVFTDPLVRDVTEAYPMFKQGALAMYAPEPTHRLMAGLRHFHQARESIMSEQARLDAEAARQRRVAGHG